MAERVSIRPHPWLWLLACGLPAGALGTLAGWLTNPHNPAVVTLVALLTGLLAAIAAFIAARCLPWTAQLVHAVEPCPRCKGVRAVRVNLTLWGGFLGTRLVHHVQCVDCGSQYNGKSGEGNEYAMVTVAATRIAVVLILLTLLLFVLFAETSAPQASSAVIVIRT